MTNYNGQEDLDPLIRALIQGNGLETKGSAQEDIQTLESAGILVIQQAIADIAIHSRELQGVS